ncbi:hypothetical protein QZH41_014023 [Actinostola sp. cb2023]|nr:hypothetical protein QZH41_014023 [Actinostola sp. cb2023]
MLYPGISYYVHCLLLIMQTPSEATEGDAKDEEKAEGTEEQIPQVDNCLLEFRDEIEQQKRALPQLSTYSCRILKKYGYCRYIAKFCIKICTCNDKLSAVSCHRVRYTYRACNKNIGRVYCAKKCGHCGPGKLPLQCRRHTRINDITRRQSRPTRRYRCDKGLRPGWYRLVGAQGTYIPNRCVPVKRCGTAATGWMVGNYPRRRGQNVRRKVCYHWAGKCCRWSNYIQVTHCGGYYVFYLRGSPGCNFRYCGNL